ALAYAIPAAGGYIGDKLLGSRRTLVLGAVVLAGGYSLLAVPDRPALLFPALALVAVGGGIFKANPANLISRLYEGDPARIDSAFTIQNREVARGIVALAFVVMVVIFGLMMRRGSDRERKGLWAVIILTAEAMLFFIFYQQMSTSLTLFSLRNVDLDLFGYQVPA